jgi:hypothetical protein
LQARAGDVLRSLGYSDKPADRARWFRTDNEYVERLNRMRPNEASTAVRTAAPGPLRFCYRQSSAMLIPWSTNSPVSAIDPPPDAGDAHVELDLRTLAAPMLAWSLAFWISLFVLGVLARRNLRLGRSDRAAARTLAVALVVAWTATVALGSQSAAALLDLPSGPGALASPLMFGLFAWLGYMRFEPQIRRASPHLLITSTHACCMAGGAIRWWDARCWRASWWASSLPCR